MPSYSYPLDGRVHTRQSELKRCTEGSIAVVVYERNNPESVFQNTFTEQGEDRHNVFAAESRETRRTPSCFDEALGGYLTLSHVEETLMNELWDGVCLWSTPDGWNWDGMLGWILDYKTANADSTKERKLTKADKRQMAIYAIQIEHKYGFKMENACLLVEFWSTDDFGNRLQVTDRKAYWFDITEEMKEEAMAWMEERVMRLQANL